jgi:hypothetical protein
MNDEERRKLSETLRTAKPEVLDEIIRQAESFLADQLKSGLAADQRAMTMAVILAAILAALVGGTASLIAAKVHLGWHLLAVFPLIVCLSWALVYAVQSARPTYFCYSGTNPTKWLPDIKDERPLHVSKAGQAAIYAQGIVRNGQCLEEGHRWLKAALRVATIGLLLFASIEFVVICSIAAEGDFSL